MKALFFVLCLSALTALAHGAPPPPGVPGGHGPYPHSYQREHPKHRLAYWYAGESISQAREARQMVCGFTGQHWTLDWDVHYRWALRASSRRVYSRVEDRDRHLNSCRRHKLREYRRPPYGRP